MTDPQTALTDETGRVIFRGTQSPGGGSTPDGYTLSGLLGPLALLFSNGGFSQTSFVAFRPGTAEAWVVCGNHLFVLDGDESVAASIETGMETPSIAFTPDGLKAYLPDFDNNKVWVVDPVARTIGPGFVATDNNPTGVAVTPDGAKAYVANHNAGTVTPIDVATDTAGDPIDVGAGTAVGGGSGPISVAFTPDGSKAYVACDATGVVVPIDVETDTPGSPITGLDGVSANNPQALAISSDGSMVYVCVGNIVLNTITTDDDTLGSSINLPLYSVAVTVNGGNAWVVMNDGSGFAVAVIDTATAERTAFIPVGKLPVAIGLSEDGKRGYVALAGTSDGGNSDSTGNLSVLRRVPFNHLS